MIRTLLAALTAIIAVPLHAETLEVRGDRVFIPVEVNGVAIEALLDSGAEVTVFDRATARRLDLPGGDEVEARGTGAGPAKAQLIENITVKALGCDIVVPVAAVMDLSDVGSRLLNAPLPMVFGREVFDHGRLRIDIEARTIAWADGPNEPGGVMLELTAAHGIETIPVRFGRAGEVAADFDLGNGTGLLVSAGLAQDLGLVPIGLEPAGGIGGSVLREVVFVPEVTIAGRTFRNVRAQVSPDMQVAANVGVGLLRNFLIVTDFPGRHVWLEARK